jgi:hypothetical protein
MEDKKEIDFNILGKLTIITIADTFSEMEDSLDVYALNKVAPVEPILEP